MTQFQTKSHTHPPAATIVRPFLYIQQLLGLHIEVDIGSTNFLVSIILLFLLLIIYLWNRRRRRIDSYRSSHAVGTPGFQRLIARQESLLLSLKESGNRAYLEREYEKAAEHFQTARDEAIHLIKMQHPTIEVLPLALPLNDGSGGDKKVVPTLPTIDEPTGVLTHYPSPGEFRTKPNPTLAGLSVPLLNNLAVYSSNRSACLLALNRYDDALAEAELARHVQPLWSKGYLRAGQAYEGLGLFARAKAMYASGARADPSDENVAKCLRNLLQLEAEVEESKREAKKEKEKLEQMQQQQQQQQHTVPPFTSEPVSPSCRSSSESDPFSALTRWLTSHGAHFPYLYLKQNSDPEDRSVHTLCRISAGKIILSVPLQCIMTSDVARASRVGRALQHVDLISNHSPLACYLLEERRKGKASFWQHYINILPRQYRNMPIFFDGDEKSWLKGSFTLDKIAERRHELQAEYENICKGLEGYNLDELINSDDEEEMMEPKSPVPSLGTLTNRRSASSKKKAAEVPPSSSSSSSSSFVPFSARHSLNDFIWARTVVITRIFGFSMNVPSSASRTGSTPYKADGLVPMSDMLNHKQNPKESSWNYDDSRQAFIITSLVNFQPRQEVHDSYGRKCNSRFFVNYGFCLDDNRADNQAVMWIPLKDSSTVDSASPESNRESDELLEKKRKLLGVAATGQSLSQSASSLSSSGYMLSTTPVDSPASSSSSSSSLPYPPPLSLRFQIPTSYADRITQEIFSLLRFIRSDGAEFQRARQPLERLEPEIALRNIPPISLENEMKVLRTLNDAALSALQQFDQSLEEDEELLRRSADPSDSFTLTPNQRNCVIMRRGEKEVHHFYRKLYEEVEAIRRDYESHVQRCIEDERDIGMNAWNQFVHSYLEPKYSSGSGWCDFYITSVISTLLQQEEQKRRASSTTPRRQ